MEQVIKNFIYIHAFFGGIGLITGVANVALKKGSQWHKNMGKIFSYAMVISSLISLWVARMPNHENLFLFLIGVFTIYMVLSGNRALTLKKHIKSKADNLDKLVSGTMALASVAMIVIGTIGVIQKNNNSTLYIFFGVLGLFMTYKDYRIFKTFTKNENAWVINHVGRIMGALIASITAFLVSGLKIDTIMVWIAPTVIGTIYIIYWNRKIRTTGKSASAPL